MAARVQQSRSGGPEEEKGGNSSVSTRSKRITKDNKAPVARGSGKKAAEEENEESQVSAAFPTKSGLPSRTGYLP